MLRLPLFTCLVTRATGRAFVNTVAANSACENNDNAREIMATNRTVRMWRTDFIESPQNFAWQCFPWERGRIRENLYCFECLERGGSMSGNRLQPRRKRVG